MENKAVLEGLLFVVGEEGLSLEQQDRDCKIQAAQLRKNIESIIKN